MEQQKHYHTLVTSLPAFKALEDNKELPLTRIHLERRLRFLAETDAALVQRVVDIVFHKSFGTTSGYIQEVVALRSDINNKEIADIINHFMLQRMLVALLRRSVKGRDLPKDYDLWTIFLGEELSERIAQNYNKPDFGLTKIGFKTILALRGALESNDALKAEKNLLNIHWTYLKEKAFDTGFGIEAVIIYVLQWNILRGWLYQKPEESLEIINAELDRIVEQTEITL